MGRVFILRCEPFCCKYNNKRTLLQLFNLKTRPKRSRLLAIAFLAFICSATYRCKYLPNYGRWLWPIVLRYCITQQVAILIKNDKFFHRIDSFPFENQKKLYRHDKITAIWIMKLPFITKISIFPHIPGLVFTKLLQSPKCLLKLSQAN